MRIVEVVHGFPPEVVGGTERYVREISLKLKQRGHEVFVLSGSLEWMEEFTVKEETIEGVVLTKAHRNDLYFDRWDKAYNPLVEEYFKAYLEKTKPDLVHVHHWVRLTSSLCATAAGLGIPVALTLHDLYSTCPRFFRMRANNTLCNEGLSPENCFQCADRWLFQQDPEIKSAVASFKTDILNELKSATKILAPSRTHGETITQRLGLDDLKVEVLPHGAMTSLSPAPRSQKGERMRIVYFSHIYPPKGPKVLIDAFCRMKHRDNVELHLYGAEVLPDFAKELKEAVSGLNVTFHGPYDPKDLEKVPMDLVVIPTLLAESYSFILDEAASLKVPILASDTGAIRERATGAVMLFKNGDKDALAAAMDLFAAHPERLDEMRSAPQVKILSMDEHMEQLEKIYSEVVQTGPPEQVKDLVFEHLKDQWFRRECGFKELIRSEQWEALVASLRKRIVELEVELAARKTNSD